MSGFKAIVSLNFYSVFHFDNASLHVLCLPFTNAAEFAFVLKFATAVQLLKLKIKCMAKESIAMMDRWYRTRAKDSNESW